MVWVPEGGKKTTFKRVTFTRGLRENVADNSCHQAPSSQIPLSSCSLLIKCYERSPRKKEAPNKCFIERSMKSFYYFSRLHFTRHAWMKYGIRLHLQISWAPGSLPSSSQPILVSLSDLGYSTKVFRISYLSYEYLRQCFPTFSKSWYLEKMMVFIIYCNKEIRQCVSMTN